MSDERIDLPAVARGERPYFFNDPAIDKLLAMFMALVGEVAVLRERHDTIERLLEREGAITRDAIEGYEPTAAVREERDAWRDAYLRQVLRIALTDDAAMARNDLAEQWSALIERLGEA